jgi:hypothetical protein
LRSSLRFGGGSGQLSIRLEGPFARNLESGSTKLVTQCRCRRQTFLESHQGRNIRNMPKLSIKTLAVPFAHHYVPCDALAQRFDLGRRGHSFVQASPTSPSSLLIYADRSSTTLSNQSIKKVAHGHLRRVQPEQDITEKSVMKMQSQSRRSQRSQ